MILYVKFHCIFLNTQHNTPIQILLQVIYQASTRFLYGLNSTMVRCDLTPGGILGKALKEVLNQEEAKESTHIVKEGIMEIWTI